MTFNQAETMTAWRHFAGLEEITGYDIQLGYVAYAIQVIVANHDAVTNPVG